MATRRPALKKDSAQKPLEVGAAIEAWLESCRERGLRPGTLKRSYPQATRRILLPWCIEAGIVTVDQLDRAALGRLATDLNERHLSKWTVSHYLRTINQFIGWLGVKDSSQKAPMPRLPKLSRDILSRREAESLEDAASNIRDQLIIRILWETACREGELVNLETHDILKRGKVTLLRFHGKTDSRDCPISPELAHRLKVYVGRQRPDSTSDRLFLSRRRDRVTREQEPLTENGVYQVVKDAADVAKFTRKVYPHLIRGSALTRMQTGGHAIHPALISRMTGVSVQVLATHYSHPSVEALQEALLANLVQQDEQSEDR